MTSQTIYREHLSEPWFTLVSLGLKTCEGRLHKNRFCEFKEGDIIEWINDDFGKERLCLTKITHINKYKTFEEYLNDKGLENCLPGMLNLEHGLGVYKKYYSLKHDYPTKWELNEKSDEEKYGVVSFELEKVNYCLTLIFNNRPESSNYVKTIDDAYKLLTEYNKNFKLGWEIDKTHITFENNTLYMLKKNFRDIEFELDDLKLSNNLSILKSVGDSKTFNNIQLTYDDDNNEDDNDKEKS